MEGNGHDWSLFDAGELGSELALVKSIFETLGTPDEVVWPDARDLPDWGKMTFVKFPGKFWEELLPNASADGRDLVSQLVRYQSTERLSAAEVSGYKPSKGEDDDLLITNIDRSCSMLSFKMMCRLRAVPLAVDLEYRTPAALISFDMFEYSLINTAVFPTVLY